MMNRFLSTIFIICMTCFPALAQNNFLTIDTIAEGEAFHFPVIRAHDTLIAKKINIHLQLGELDVIPGKAKQSMFKTVQTDNGSIYGGKTAIDYTLLANNNRNLAIELNESSCGMTCAYWNRYYNFNPQNGDRYALQDFFSKAGFKSFKDTVTRLRQQGIRKQIEALKGSDTLIESLESYIYGQIADDKLEAFYFTNDSLFFDSWNLLSKPDKFYGLKTITGISIKSIQPLLNNYGKAALLDGKNLSSYQGTTVPQVYEGRVNNTSGFYLLFRQEDDNHYEGTYAYKRYGQAIYLEGELNNGIYSFNEKDSNFETTATLTFSRKGRDLSGYWQDKKGHKYKLEAKKL